MLPKVMGSPSGVLGAIAIVEFCDRQTVLPSGFDLELLHGLAKSCCSSGAVTTPRYPAFFRIMLTDHRALVTDRARCPPDIGGSLVSLSGLTDRSWPS